MTIKLGRENIQRLMTRVLEKYETESGKQLNRNKTPVNYIGVANILSALSAGLPERCPENFKSDNTGRYDVTGAQVRDAYFGQNDSLKDHFYEACHLFLYDKLSGDCKDEIKEAERLQAEASQQLIEPAGAEVLPPVAAKKSSPLLALSIILFALLLFAGCKWYSVNNRLVILTQDRDSVNQRLTTLRHDMRILPYVPTAAEIAALVGVWKVYTGSPQARKWDANRCNMTVPNMMEIRYKDGYFVFERYGPAFNQDGFMQLEAPGIVSIHSRVLNDSGNMVSPKHSLMILEKGKTQLNAISASWNFDFKDNKVLGIREVFIKKGNGTLAELKNSLLETVYDRVLQWTKPDQRKDTIGLKNERLEDVEEKEIRVLLNKNSIVLKDPDPTLLLDCTRKN